MTLRHRGIPHLMKDILGMPHLKDIPVAIRTHQLNNLCLMKAIRVETIGGPEVLKLKQVDVPVPGPKQVLIKVEAASVNPVDVYARQGGLTGLCTPPYTPGGDVAGVVEKVGPQVIQFKPGDRVYSLNRDITGAYAEYAVFDKAEVFPLHADLSFAQGACMGLPYFTAYRALLTYGLAESGDTVLVHGASGGVGLAACQIARANGLNVLGTAGSKQGIDMILKNGAHKAFNHWDPGHIQEIKTSVGEDGVKVILEMGANENLQNDLQVAASRGRIVVIGGVKMQTAGGCSVINVNTSTILDKEVDIRGIHVLRMTDAEMAHIAVQLEAGVQQGWLRPQVSRQFALAEADKAHEEVIKQQTNQTNGGSMGKIILTV